MNRAKGGHLSNSLNSIDQHRKNIGSHHTENKANKLYYKKNRERTQANLNNGTKYNDSVNVIAMYIGLCVLIMLITAIFALIYKNSS
jgi:uncharacterized membrane protein